MASPLALLDAIKLAEVNKSDFDRLEHKRLDAERKADVAEAGLGAANVEAFDAFLAPFAVAFARLKNTELCDLPLVGAVPELTLMDVDVKKVGVQAVEGLTMIAGSAAAGAAVGGLTFAAVRTFAVDSTGMAISSLSGAAATRATLSWLAGGRGVAAGSAVLAGVVAVPALTVLGGFLWWKGAKELKQQQEIAIQLRHAEHDLEVRLLGAKHAVKRAKQTAKVVSKLADVGMARLSRFESLVFENEDYSTYTSEAKEIVAVLAGIATTLSAVMAAPILDEAGKVTEESAEALDAGRALVGRLTLSTEHEPRLSKGSPSATAADAAAWSAVDEVTRTTREQLAYLLTQGGVVSEIARRFGNLGAEQRQGHLFEWLHELEFNLDAISKDSDLRLRVTTWLNEPHAADDLRLLDGNDDIVGGAQAKVIGSATARLAGRGGLTDPKYEGLDLLTPSDHVDDTRSLIERRLAMPEGPMHERYASVNERLTDHFEHEGVSSDPVSLADLKTVDSDTEAFLRSLIETNEFKQIATAGVTAGVIGAVVGGVSNIAVARVKSGSFKGVDWTQAGLDAARAGGAAAAVAIAGQTITVAAQQAVAAGGGAAAQAFAGGSLPFALSRGAADLASIGHGLATHRLPGQKAAIRCAESVTRTSAIWACAAIGQTIIPLPVIGSVVGGIVGQYGSAMLIEGLKLAVLARDTSAQWDVEYEQLLREADAVRQRAEAELAWLHEIDEVYDTAFAGLVLPKLDGIAASVGSGRPDEVLSELADLTLLCGGTPLFASMEAFERFMANAEIPLSLDLGGSTVARYQRGGVNL